MNSLKEYLKKIWKKYGKIWKNMKDLKNNKVFCLPTKD